MRDAGRHGLTYLAHIEDRWTYLWRAEMKKITLLPIFIAVTVAACGTTPTSSGILQSGGTDGYSLVMHPFIGVEAESEKLGMEEAQAKCDSIDRKFVRTQAEAMPHADMYFVAFRCEKKMGPGDDAS